MTMLQLRRNNFKIYLKYLSNSNNNDKFTQELSPLSNERRVPATRLERMINFGGLAAGIGIGTISEVIRRNLEGANNANNLRTAALSEANIERIVASLCKVRGAALKLAQFLSIQDSNFLSPKMRKIFDRVRQSADYMPPSQLKKVLEKELGPNWRKNFVEFEGKPFAAASIGQVHRGRLVCGRQVAVKVQYIGVDESIDSDIRSLLTLVNITNLFPTGLYVERAAEVAKRELMLEVDYDHEARCMREYRGLLGDDEFLVVPEVLDNLCTKHILTSELICGQPVNTLGGHVAQPVINEVCSNILRLVLTELYCWRFMQSDPNWSNFYYDISTHKLNLLDFGATRRYSKQFVDDYLRLTNAAINDEKQKVLAFSRQIGFLTGEESGVMEEAHCTSIMILAEALRSDSYDFGRQDATNRIASILPVMMKNRLTPPPEETYSLHRKMSGIFMLFCELKAVVPCLSIFEKVKAGYKFD